MVFLRQLDRTNLAASRDYASSVMQKLNNLPTQYRNKVLKRDAEFRNWEMTLVFKSYCGVKLGTAENPMLIDEMQPIPRFLEGEIDYDDPNIKQIIIDKETNTRDIILYDPDTPVKRHIGEIDYSDPNIISPKLKELESVDYQLLDAVIMEEAENAGLTWSVEKETFMVGHISILRPPFDKEPHPLLDEEIEEDENEEEPEAEP